MPDSHSPKSSNHQHGIEAELVTVARRALREGSDAVEPLQQLLHHYVCTAPQWPKASRVAARLVEVQESLHGPNSPELLPALGELATALSIVGDDDRSEAILQRALRIAELAYGPASPQARHARYRLFEHYLLAGSVGLAEATLEPFGPPPEGSFNAWARLYERQGRLAEWQDVVERWLAQTRRGTDKTREDDRNLEITLLTQLASVYAQQDAWALAEQQLREALGLYDKAQAQRRRERSGTAPAVAAALSSMVTVRRVELLVQHADALRALGQWQEADDCYQAGLDALERSDAGGAELPGRTAVYDGHRALSQNELRARLLRGRAAVLRERGTFDAAEVAEAEAARLQAEVRAFRTEAARTALEARKRSLQETGPEL